MLDVLKVILLGIVEGITEWLPVSSTGHLILVGNVLKPGLSDAFMEMFNVVIQLGAIMAVVVLYFHKLNPFSPKKTQKQKLLTWQMWIKVLIACSKPLHLFLWSDGTTFLPDRSGSLGYSHAGFQVQHGPASHE